ncbi:uncharacterized protein LOC106472267 isoform X2 [Limulus polyphemus]|uniref:Uncharacterized protein LOC106472267 isoform X2 n=1 Tax=Limulus polyphemus TaxID=6850 RepID=A0ABM1TL15_LIMPO|nr:uncharacterized protein LOC106472267 isoform X2 [Limulus polyphemus]
MGKASVSLGPSLQHIEGTETNDHVKDPATCDTVSLDSTARTKDRALPDIPLPATVHNSTSDSNSDSVADNSSECYATVAKGIVNPNKSANQHIATKPSATNEVTVSIPAICDDAPYSTPLTPASVVTTSLEFLQPSCLIEDLKKSESGVNNLSHTHSTVIKAQPVHHSVLPGHIDLDEQETDDCYDNPEATHLQKRQISTKVPVWPYFPTFSSYQPPSASDQSNGETIDSENFLISQASGLLLPLDTNEEGNRNSSIARQAVAGQIPSVEIPYMTPPLQQSPQAANVENVIGATFSGSQDIPYNVISVREPLAKIREETLKLQQQQKRVPRNQYSDGHYVVVPDMEEMYEEIDPDSERSSSLYASIEPGRLQHPPAPPTVESLKSVAQAHSRQASLASVISFESNEMMEATEDDTFQPFKNLTSLYSIVDKSNKQRQTIHLAEGVSYLSKSKVEPHSVEDMYAKVHKKRFDSSPSVGVEEMKINVNSFVGIMLVPSNLVKNPAVVVDYQPDPCPTTCHQVANSAIFPTGSSFSKASSRAQLTDLINKADEKMDSDVGYEPLKHPNDPDYESAEKQRHITSDPDYEPLKHQNNITTDPSYESIKHIKSANNDPGYERVKGDYDDLRYEEVSKKAIGEIPANGFSREHIGITLKVVAKDQNLKHHGYESLDDLCKNESRTVDSYYDNNSEFDDGDYEPMKQIERQEGKCAGQNHEKIHRISGVESHVTNPDYETVKSPNFPPWKTTNFHEPCYEVVHGAVSKMNEPGHECLQNQVSEKQHSAFGHTEEFFNLADSSNKIQD